MPDPTARLIASTRRRLIVVTLSLVALLLLGIGAATAFVGLRALDVDVDRALQVSVDTAVAALDGELPQGQESNESDETVPAAADTFLVYLDPKGTEVANPSGVVLSGLPDTGALAPAAATGSDLRTVQAGAVDVRLLTEPIPSSSGGPPIGYVQGGFVLTLHDQQSNSLIAAVVVVAVVGLIGAALVTLVVTGDALVPIRRSFAAQRRFVADASHELKTPPAIIRANAEVLERESLVTDDGRPLVADIVTETDRLSRLVGDLLQLASADATGLVIERVRIDLGAVAADTVRQTQALAAEHDVTLRDESPTADVTVVSGDRDRLTQLILILLDNAIDHAPPATAVVVSVRRSGRRVELTVADQGPGVPPAERARVFEPFTRLPGVRRDRAGGTGLGLAIARRIVVAHDGTIAVHDAPGGGARFVVSLPATSDGPRSG
jgi:two-component system, OmpR family, sensor histidine kinase CiaH